MRHLLVATSALAISVAHFLASLVLIGRAIALGDAGETLTRPQEIALRILTVPTRYIAWLPLRLFEFLVGDAFAYFGIVALNSLIWGISLAIMGRWLMTRLRWAN